MTMTNCEMTCAHCDELAAENERLQQTTHVLLAANQRLLDAIAVWTYPTIPNN